MALSCIMLTVIYVHSNLYPDRVHETFNCVNGTFVSSSVFDISLINFPIDAANLHNIYNKYCYKETEQKLYNQSRIEIILQYSN